MRGEAASNKRKRRGWQRDDNKRGSGGKYSRKRAQ